MKWRHLFRRSKAVASHAQERESFLEFEIEENIARGMTPEEAGRAARIKFGNPTTVREEVYRMNSSVFLETIGRDLRYAVRTLKAKPAFTIVSLITLALGIGATTAIFTMVNGVILRPLPYPDPERLVTIWETNPNYSAPGCGGCIHFSPGNYLDVRDQNRAFERIGGFSVNNYNLTGGGPPERIVAGLTSASLFSTLGLQPAIGRAFVHSDDSPAASLVVVLSHNLWLNRFGGNPRAIGSTLRLDDQPYTIIGVMPAGFRLLDADVDLWLPMERMIEPRYMHWRWSYFVRVVGRLKPGVNSGQAREDVDRIMTGIHRQFPDSLGKGAAVVPLLHDTVARARGPLWILFGAVGFVLLIACANVANLNLGRATSRRREIAVRLALGASRSRIVRQLFTESMVLALTGGALGFAIAQWGVGALLRLAPNEIPRAADIHVDAWVFGFTLLAASLAAVIFGLFPAMSASKADPQHGLKSSDRATSARTGARGALAIAEISIALVLLIGAGLMIESFRRLLAVEPGFNPHGLISLRVPLSQTRYNSKQMQSGFYRKLLDHVSRVPGLKTFGVIDGLPFSDGGFDNAFTIDGRPKLPPGQFLISEIRRTDPPYFQTMGIPLLQGRTFIDSDNATAPVVTVISQSLARRYWGTTSPLGKYLTIAYGPPEGTRAHIVGVAGDVRAAFDAKPLDYIYLHYPQGGGLREMHLVLRPQSADTSAVIAAVRTAIGALDPDQPVYRVQTMEATMFASVVTRRFQMFLLTAFATLAACLASIGLYGVLAYSVQARTREIGIRTALGAATGRVFATILGDALRLIAIGLAAGLAGAFALTRVLTTMLFGVEPTDLRTFALVSMLLLAVSLAAALIPARRAARVDPVVALRYE